MARVVVRTRIQPIKRRACSVGRPYIWGVVLALGLGPASALAKTPVTGTVKDRPRASLEVEFEGMTELAQSSLEPRLVHQGKRVFAQARLQPASHTQDLWIRAQVSKRVDEDGNPGFDLIFLGQHSGRQLRWPELERRCTLCTHGEFVEVFGRALSSLVKYGMLDKKAPSESVGSKSTKGVKLAAAKSTPANRLQVVGKRMELQPMDPVPLNPARARRPSLRWWGWMGVGLGAAGTATIITSLATMPRNVPLPHDPTQMYPLRFDRGTRIGVIVGGSTLLIGVGLWVFDTLSGAPLAKSKRRTLTSVSPLVWEF